MTAGAPRREIPDFFRLAYVKLWVKVSFEEINAWRG